MLGRLPNIKQKTADEYLLGASGQSATLTPQAVKQADTTMNKVVRTADDYLQKSGVKDLAKGYMQTPGEKNFNAPAAEQIGHDISNAPTPLGLGDDIIKAIPAAVGAVGAVRGTRGAVMAAEEAKDASQVGRKVSQYGINMAMGDAKTAQESIDYLNKAKNIDDFMSNKFTDAQRHIREIAGDYLGTAWAKKASIQDVKDALQERIRLDFNIK